MKRFLLVLCGIVLIVGGSAAVYRLTHDNVAHTTRSSSITTGNKPLKAQKMGMKTTSTTQVITADNWSQLPDWLRQQFPQFGQITPAQPYRQPYTQPVAQPPAQPSTPAAPTGTAPGTGTVEAQVLQLVNAERGKAGLSALTMNGTLSSVAKTKASDMRDKNYFSHDSPTYGSPFDMMKQFGISYSYAGENIAAGQQTAQAVMTAWMNSPGHRQNIMSPNFTQMGIGYSPGGNMSPYWSQMFIRP